MNSSEARPRTGGALGWSRERTVAPSANLSPSCFADPWGDRPCSLGGEPSGLAADALSRTIRGRRSRPRYKGSTSQKSEPGRVVPTGGTGKHRTSLSYNMTGDRECHRAPTRGSWWSTTGLYCEKDVPWGRRETAGTAARHGRSVTRPNRTAPSPGSAKPSPGTGASRSAPATR